MINTKTRLLWIKIKKKDILVTIDLKGNVKEVASDYPDLDWRVIK